MSDSNDSTNTGDNVSLSSAFLDFCVKVRISDPSILPEPGKPFKIHYLLSETHVIELAGALLENTNVTYLQLETETYTNSSAEAMAEYVRTSKRLQRIVWIGEHRSLPQHEEEMLSLFLPAFQGSTSLKKLHMKLPRVGGPYLPALENMLMHTQSVQFLCLIYPDGPLENRVVAAAKSGLKGNTALRELTLQFSRAAKTVSPILTSLRGHPHLRRLHLRGCGVDLTGLKTLLRSRNSNITELVIHEFSEDPPMKGLTGVLQALARYPTLTELGLRYRPLNPQKAKLLREALYDIPSLQSIVLTDGTLGIAGLAKLAPALYNNTSIKGLDLSGNDLNDLESAVILGDILRRNESITTLDLSENNFGQTTGAVKCIADGLGSNSTLLKIDLSDCGLGDDGVFILAQTLGSRNTALQKLTLSENSVTSTGVGVLVETMEQSSHHITDLDLSCNRIGNEGASLLANVLPNLTRLSLANCGIGDDGLIALVSALTQNDSLLYLDLRSKYRFSERAFLALAESLPEMKVLQRFDFSWSANLGAAMPSLLVGLRENTSLFRFHLIGYAPSSVPPTTEETVRCAGGWMQEIERLGYRNRFLPLVPPRGVWPYGLARVATLPNVIFEVLRSKQNLVSSDDA